MNRLKGCYMLFGIFTEEIEEVVAELKKALHITILKSELEGDDELYYAPQKYDVIRHFAIQYGSPLGYHYSETEILYPSYLLMCNTFSKDKIEEMDNIRKTINAVAYIKELDVDIVDIDDDE